MRYRSLFAALAIGVAFGVAACGGGGGSDNNDSGSANKDVSGSLSMMAIWAGEEQASFQAVIDGFTELYPNVTVKYTSGGDNIVTVLSTAVEGGNPPDIATVSQPGTMVSNST